MAQEIERPRAGGQDREEIRRLLAGYRLTTAEIIYRMPDHRELLQTYIWQNYDLAPEFPQLRKFLDFWEENLDGPIYSVRVAAQKLVTPGKWRHLPGLFTLQ